MSMIQSSCALVGARSRLIAGYREVQHGQVHGVEQRRQEDHGEADPLSSPGLGYDHLLHKAILVVGTQGSGRFVFDGSPATPT